MRYSSAFGIPLFYAGSLVAALGGAGKFEWLVTVEIATTVAAAIGFAIRTVTNKFRAD